MNCGIVVLVRVFHDFVPIIILTVYSVLKFYPSLGPQFWSYEDVLNSLESSLVNTSNITNSFIVLLIVSLTTYPSMRQVWSWFSV